MTKKKANEDWNNRILIIDADAFKFKQGAPLEDNKTNPLFSNLHGVSKN